MVPSPRCTFFMALWISNFAPSSLIGRNIIEKRKIENYYFFSRTLLDCFKEQLSKKNGIQSQREIRKSL